MVYEVQAYSGSGETSNLCRVSPDHYPPPGHQTLLGVVETHFSLSKVIDFTFKDLSKFKILGTSDPLTPSPGGGVGEGLQHPALEAQAHLDT